MLFPNVHFIGNEYLGAGTLGLLTVSCASVEWIGSAGFESVIYCKASSNCEITIQESRVESNNMTLVVNALLMANNASTSITLEDKDFRPNTAQSEVEFYNNGDSTMTFTGCTFDLLTAQLCQQANHQVNQPLDQHTLQQNSNVQLHHLAICQQKRQFHKRDL